ncbi:hypothetical protein Hte_001595 [Hypoxylon texense]
MSASESDDKSVGDGPATAPATAPQDQGSTSFVWDSCDDFDDQKRIAIKEDALAIGIEKCEQLIKRFEASVLGTDGLHAPTGSSILGREALEKWVGGCKDLIQRHKDFKVLVGVAGPTGSGKTSTLNALLGFSELLPTSNQEAATAVACKVAYNDDERPGHRFRAIVTFRTKTNLTKQLDQFFEDMRGRDELRKAGTGSVEDYEALRNANANLKPSFEMIRTVFGLGEKEVASMTTKDLLRSNEDVGRLLGKTKRYHGSNVDQLSEKIKPYMDSTVAQHTKSGSEFAAWPLIDEVELFVKSEILRNGVVLVDLPGLADSVESRAAIAENYFSKLAATLIVSPARRAADDSTSVKLMSDHQELRLKMDGKFHKRSYCVAVSQIDQIDRRSALRTRDAKSNLKLQRLLAEEETLKLKKKEKAQEHKDAKKELGNINAELRATGTKAKQAGKNLQGVTKKNPNAAKYRQRKVKQTAAVARLKDELDDLDDNLKTLGGHLIFLCVQARNKFLEDRIQHDFKQRQAHIASSSDGLKTTYDGSVSVCPVSAKAFWPCVQDEDRLPGFPDERYSGIPNLAHWIRTATVSERESHANTLLHDLNNYFNMIRTWSRKEWAQSRLQVSRRWVEETIFPSTYTALEESLDKWWKTLKKKAATCNPLRDRTDSLHNCVEGCREVVHSWSYKSAEDDTEAAKIHWLTYQANIQRHGFKFVSKASHGCAEYSWMEDLSDVLLKTIVVDWNKALNHDIPELAPEACKAIDTRWGDFLKRLRISVQSTYPELLPFLDDIMPSLDTVKQQVKDKVRQALKEISNGSGSLKQRQDMITEFAQNSGQKMFNAAFQNMRKQLNLNFEKFPRTLEGISKFAVEAVKDHIDVFLNNVIEPDIKMENMEGEVEEKLELQRDVSSALLQWDLEWKVSEAGRNPAESIETIALPGEYLYEEGEVMETDEDESVSSEGEGSEDEDEDEDEDDGDSETEDSSYIDDH